MMNTLSDTESSDSDTGRRYKTESTREREDVSTKRREKNSPYDCTKVQEKNYEGRIRKITEEREKSHRKRDRYEKVDDMKHYQSGNQTNKSNKLKDKSRLSHNLSESKKSHEHRTSLQKKSRSRRYDSNDHKSKGKNIDPIFNHHEKYKKHNENITDNEDERRNSEKPNTSKSTSKQSADEFKTLTENLICGPSLPPHMLNRDSVDQDKSAERSYGPSLPPSQGICTSKNESETIPNSENEEEHTIGPILETFSNKSEVYLKLEKRALELKLAKLNKQDGRGVDPSQQREEWMTELPNLPTVSGLGLTARQFKMKEHEEIKDRSLWTNMPRDREKKQVSSHNDLTKIQHEIIENVNRKRKDAEQEVAILKHKKKHKRDESLLQIHQKKLKEKSIKDTESIERRPFCRDTDLKINRFDEAQKKSVLKKAQLLDSRFSSGQTKYL